MKRFCVPKKAVIATVLVSGMLFTGVRGCEPAVETESITIAVSRLPISAPVFVAYEKNSSSMRGSR